MPYNLVMTLRDAAKQFLVYLYARKGYCLSYWQAASALRHLLLCTGNRPLAEVRQRHFLMYFTVVVSEQPRVSLDETRRRSRISQSFLRWMLKNGMVR